MIVSSLTGFFAGFVGGLFTWFAAERKLQLQYVTNERAKWRKSIRRKSLEIYDALIHRDKDKLNRLKFELTLLLNPTDRHDVCIIKKLKDSINAIDKLEGSTLDEIIDDFVKSIALLLKHDWERAKKEAKWYGFMCSETERIEFRDYKECPCKYIQKPRRFVWQCASKCN